MSLHQARRRNELLRGNGDEPEPGLYAGIKRWARYHSRVPAREIKIKNPDKYLHAHARGMAALRRALPKV